MQQELQSLLHHKKVIEFLPRRTIRPLDCFTRNVTLFCEEPDPIIYHQAGSFVNLLFTDVMLESLPLPFTYFKRQELPHLHFVQFLHPAFTACEIEPVLDNHRGVLNF